MEPIDYTRDVLSPLQGYMQGLQFGEGIVSARQARDEAKQAMGLRMAEESRAAEAFSMQKAAAEKAKADAERGQAELTRLAGLGAGATDQDFMRAWIANPAIRDDLTSLQTTMSAPKIATMTTTAQNLYAAASQGNAEAVRGLLSEQLAAAENAGDQTMIPMLRASLDQLDADPQAAMGALRSSTGLTLMGLKGPEYLKQMNEVLGVGADATGTFKTLQERAKAAGLVEGSPEYQKFMLQGGEPDKGPLVQNVVGAGETEFAKTAGKENAALFSTITNQGVTASRNLTELDTLEAVLSDVETGAGASVKAYLGKYGVATEGLDKIQAANAAIQRLIPTQRPPNSGTITEGDMRGFALSVPSLINQPGGNKIIIDTIRAINEYDVAASIISGRALDGELTPAQARQALRDLPNPLAEFKAPKAVPTTATQPVVIDGVTIQRIE